MTVLIILLAVLIALTGAFLFVPLEFGLEIIKTADKNATYLRFKVLGVPVKIPLNTPQKSGKKSKPKKKNSNLTFESFKKRVTDFKEVYNAINDELKEMLSFVRKHTTVKCIDFDVRFGFDNAAATGISTGVIWGLGSFLLKVVDSLVGVKKINMQVNPDFNNKIFNIYSKTILIIKPIHLIIVLRKVLKTHKFVNNKINNTKGGANYGRKPNQ